MMERHVYSVTEARNGILHDLEVNTQQLGLLHKALRLLDNPSTTELVLEWFDTYMSIYDEDSYMENGKKLEELESRIKSI